MSPADWLPSCNNAGQPTLGIFKMLVYFPDTICTAFKAVGCAGAVIDSDSK